MEPLIDVREVSRQFGNLIAVDRFSIQIAAGESFALLGPDGAGKTTLMRLLCGALKPSAGKIQIAGLDIVRKTDQARERLGYMPQRFSLYETLNVTQNITFFSNIHGVDSATRQRRMEELLHVSRLTPFADRLASQLSGGMKQKLALICTILHRPPILLLDEPTTGVDPVSRRDFWQILHRQLAEGITLVVSTPHMDEAERCSRIGLMHMGKLLLTDTPAGLKSRMQGAVLEIQCVLSHAMRRQLEAHEAVVSVQAFSDSLRVLVQEARDTSVIREFLKSQGVEITGFRKVAPNVEDVFIALLGNRTREDHGSR